MKDPRVTAYISKAKPFARPILTKVRALAHAAAPGLEENIKWGAPSFEKDGRIVFGMAGFTAHCAVFFKGKKFRRIETVADLPSAELTKLVKKTVS